MPFLFDGGSARKIVVCSKPIEGLFNADFLIIGGERGGRLSDIGLDFLGGKYHEGPPPKIPKF